MKEPVEFLYDKYGVNYKLIENLVCGQRHFGLMLKNGSIGVCSTLKQSYTVKPEILAKPDFSNISHRILLNAYFNAIINGNNIDEQYFYGDIFQAIDFKKYSNIVMIGLFRPLVKKFNDAGIPVSVFDKIEKEPPVLPDDLQINFVKKSDALIITATTFFNCTFTEIIENTDKCDVFILGPSAIISNDIFNYKNVKAIFGSVFRPFDKDVLQIIKAGYGTKTFAQRANKVYILNQ